MEVEPVEVGDVVRYVDALGKSHYALVTAVWGSNWENELDIPSLNVVYVSDDEAKRDPYGVQVERNTSVVHQSRQAAPGLYWTNVQ